MIDKVFIFSIERAKDHQQKCKARLLEKSFPESIIEIWNGLDNANFKKTSELLQYAIESKGYTFLRKSLAIGLHNVAPIAWIAQSIAYLDILSYIAKRPHTAMILFDDHAVSRDYNEINTAIRAEIPTNFYGLFMAQPPWFEEPHLIENLKEKGTYGMTPEDGRVTMDGLQVPSESGMIVSPRGAGFFLRLFKECLTTQENEHLWTSSFALALNHRMHYLNDQRRTQCFSFLYPWVYIQRYDPDMPCLIEVEDGTLRRPISETSDD